MIHCFIVKEGSWCRFHREARPRNIDTVAVGSLKALHPEWPMREADIAGPFQIECDLVHTILCCGRPRSGSNKPEGADMTELNEIFDRDQAQLVFIVGSTIFIALYACGILLRRSNQSQSRMFAYPGRITMVALFLVTMIYIMADRLGLLNSGVSEAAVGLPSLSINDLHKAANIRTLPVQEVENPF
jgi:hypothetical protein